MDPVTIAFLIATAGGLFWLREKKPGLLPKFLQPKAIAAAGPAVAKQAAISNAVAASTPTPSPAVGLDPGMTTAQIAAANQALSSSTDADALYQMASQYSQENFVKTSQALIAKADAITQAKKQGASDNELFSQMMAQTAGMMPSQQSGQSGSSS